MTASVSRIAWSDGAAGPVLAAEDRAGQRADWRAYAACKGEDPELFWPGQGGDYRRAAEARAVCGRCFVRDQCLAFALEIRPPSGIWGGQTFDNGHPFTPRPAEVRKATVRKVRERQPRPPRPPRVISERCANQHVRTEENTRIDKRGRIVCRECQADRCAKSRRLKKEAA